MTTVIGRAGVVLLAGVGVLLAASGAQAPAGGPAAAAAAPGSKPDRTYVANGPVFALARSGNTVYLGGAFTRLGPRTGPFVSLDASTGKAQSGWPEVAGGTVEAIVSDDSGGWYIGGDFTHVGGLARHGLAHVLSDGSVDPSYDPSPDQPVLALLYFGGELYVGGEFKSIGGQTRTYLALLDANGQATSWNPAPDNQVDALAVHPSISVVNPTTIFVGGFFSSIGGQTRKYLAQLNLDGSVTGWDPSPDNAVFSLAVTGAGLTPIKVYAGGEFMNIGGQPRAWVAQLDGSGAATSWDANANGIVRTIAVSGSTAYVGGSFLSIGGQTRNHVAALDTTTGDATTWAPEADSDVDTLAVVGGTVYAGGNFKTIGGQARDYLAALDAATGQATSWNPDPNEPVNALAVDGGSVFVGGGFSSVGGITRDNLAALDAGTGVPTSWNPDANNTVETIAVSGSTVYVGGFFTSVGGGLRDRIGALDASTGDATSWQPEADGIVNALAVSGSTVYAGGSFTTIGGQSRNGLAALDASSGAATAWNPSAPGVDAIALSGTTVYVGGGFGLVDGQSRHHLAADRDERHARRVGSLHRRRKPDRRRACGLGVHGLRRWKLRLRDRRVPLESRSRREERHARFVEPRRLG